MKFLGNFPPFFILVCICLNDSMVAADCAKEFDKCVMPRDCCDGLSCVAGDWEVTTDSTCLSSRSENLNALTIDQRVKLIQTFYTQQAAGKSPEEAKALVEKYERSFAKLVSRIERKYGVAIDEEQEL
mmetsp:Transcript_15190/g.21493  ORF Transcript_15190/g.21493 Transcript_15190/m.21493 type:complete len:128 (-) Transcript_15190:537-920(-)